VKSLHFAWMIVVLIAAVISGPTFAQSYPAPLVNQPLVPASIAPGGSRFTLTVNGAEFVSGAVVNWNGVPLPTTFINHNKLTAKVAAVNIANIGTFTITVTNPIPGGTSNGVLFSVTNPTPSMNWNPLNDGVSPSVIADFNNDGKPDLAVAQAGIGDDSTVSILLGAGNGTFSQKSQLSFPSGANSIVMAAGDFNQDGKTDLAIFNSGDCFEKTQVEPCVDIFLGNGDGTFTLASQMPGVDGDYYALALGDFNGDGKPDLVVSFQPGEGPPIVDVYLGNGDGSFSLTAEVGGGCYLMGESMAVGDFNGDGILDLAVAGQYCEESGGVIPLGIFLGNGDGSFTPAVTQPTVTSAGSVVTADFDGDGILDLFVGVVLHGDGTFTQIAGEKTLPGGVTAGADFAVADINGDGKLDLVSSGGVYLGNGNGTFQNQLVIPNCCSPWVADFNGDGRLDLVGNNSILLQSAIVSLSRSVLEFGGHTVHTTTDPFATQLVNTGSAPLSIASISIIGPNSGDFAETNTCGKVVPIGAGCKIEVIFTPSATGLRTASVRILDNVQHSPQIISLRGQGTTAATH
jgi:hypothetical protein